MAAWREPVSLSKREFRPEISGLQDLATGAQHLRAGFLQGILVMLEQLPGLAESQLGRNCATYIKRSQIVIAKPSEWNSLGMHLFSCPEPENLSRNLGEMIAASFEEVEDDAMDVEEDLANR